MIVHLIAKDLRAYHRMIIGNLIFGAVFINLTARLNPANLSGYVTQAAVFIGVGIIVFLFSEKLLAVHQLVLSLPVTRTTVVLARYLTSFVIALMGTVLWIGFTWVSVETNSAMPFTFAEAMTPKVALIVAITLLGQISIFTPAYFRFGKLIGALFFPISMLIPLFFTVKILGVQSRRFVPEFTAADFPLYPIAGVMAVVAVALSFLLSRSIYKARDV